MKELRHNPGPCMVAHTICVLIGLSLFMTVNIQIRGQLFSIVGGEMFLIVIPSMCFEGLLHILWYRSQKEKCSRRTPAFLRLRRQGN